ncbi:PaaI family thioesterase [uncultured Sphingomonas sp.]|uniref:PaaI family thioesterase n=1 Tax=uncultured Sphingomonas sp. TaxID=158754 RepID=UPI0035CC04D3
MAPTIFDDLPMLPVARLLGWELIAVNPGAGTIEVGFLARTEFTNPFGFVQGGLVAAMLDDTLGPAPFAIAAGTNTITTIDLHIYFVRPVRPSRTTAKAEVVSMGRSIAFLRGELFDADGMLCATATASAMLTDYRSG